MDGHGQVDEERHKLDGDTAQPVRHLVLQAPGEEKAG